MPNSQKKTFTEKTLEKIREGKGSQESQKKRKWSKIIMLVDGIFIVLILLFYYGNKKTNLYKTTDLSVKNIDIRCSVNFNNETKLYYFTTTLKSQTNAKQQFHFKNSIGKITIFFENKKLAATLIGRDITSIVLYKDKIKTYISTINSKKIDSLIKEKFPQKIFRKKTLFTSKGSQILLTAEFNIYIDEVYTKIKFNHEVKDVR